MRSWKYLATSFLCLLPLLVRGEDAPLRDDEQFRWQQLILPGTLITAGTVCAASGWYGSAVNDWMKGGRCLQVDDYIQYLPVASMLVLGRVAEPRHSFRERLCITGTAYASMGILVNGLKYTVREKRPDTSARQSFPSGHSATAFMGAELVRREYGGWYGAGAYTVATATALSRIYNNRHWAVDIIAGAAVGILSAHIGYWLLPLGRSLFHLDAQGAQVIVLPSYGGCSLAVVF
ncbi:MAG: phosphatase PAP2 family protein [Bacteroidales bacterium]|nr:phosphatase PAP2 family protein [Bacteroidales bacterium]